MLQKAGYEVEEASNGEEGVEKYNQNPADVVIVDMLMPTKSGLEVIQELKRDSPTVQIIAISRFGIRQEPDMISLARQYGACRAFEKPFHMEELLNAVEELLEEDC